MIGELPKRLVKVGLVRVKSTESKDWVREGNLGHIRPFMTLLN